MTVMTPDNAALASPYGAAATGVGEVPRYVIVLNARAGTASEASAEVIEKLAKVHSLDATVDARFGVPLDTRLADAARTDASVVVAAGGDGTVTAAAQVLFGTSKALGILPLGTANLLARDLGLPFGIDRWFAALPTFERRLIDAGEVNGRLFLHKVVLGTVLRTAEAREEIRDRADLRAGVEYLVNFCSRLSHAGRFAAEVATDTAERHLAIVEALAVANNAYDEGVGRFFSRHRLDRGKLTVYLLHHLRLFHAVRLATEMLLGAWRRDANVEIEEGTSVTIRTRGRTVKVMVDGEILRLQTPLRFRIRPQAVPVLAAPLTTADPQRPALEGVE